jgi:hypothetical protein
MKMKNRATASTICLWDVTHSALCAGRWSEARALLDDLGRRSNVVDSLLSVAQYGRMSGKALPAGYDAVIQDRIDLVNSKVA